MSQLSLDVRDTVCASLRPIAELAHMYALSGDKDIKTGLVDVDAGILRCIMSFVESSPYIA